LKSRLWSGGAMWLAAFFVAGMLYTFRSRGRTVALVFTRRSRCCCFAGGAEFRRERAARGGLARAVVMIFGGDFFFVLLGATRRCRNGRACHVGAARLAALPLAHDALEPRRLHFQYPRIFPALFQGMKQELARRDALAASADGRRAGGVAWYGGVRCGRSRRGCTILRDHA